MQPMRPKRREEISAKSDKRMRPERVTPKKKQAVQEKVDPTTARVSCNVGTVAVVEPTPAHGSVYGAQGESDAASNTALGSTRRHLEFDPEEVEQAHAEHGYHARADTCQSVVLQAEAAAVAMMTSMMSQP